MNKFAKDLIANDIVKLPKLKMRARVLSVREGCMWELLHGHIAQEKPRQPCIVVWLSYERPVLNKETGWRNSFGCYHIDSLYEFEIYKKKT